MKWKDVPGWEKFYQVSDQGEVRSLPRKLWFARAGVDTFRTLPGRALKPQMSTRGYPKVSLTKPGKRVQILIHSLVLSAFKGPCPKGLQACHNDGKKWNNRIANLRYDTCQANIDDRERHRRERK